MQEKNKVSTDAGKANEAQVFVETVESIENITDVYYSPEMLAVFKAMPEMCKRPVGIEGAHSYRGKVVSMQFAAMPLVTKVLYAQPQLNFILVVVYEKDFSR